MTSEYVVDGRITGMPRSAVERRKVLEWLVEDFDTGRRYSEPMVNLIVGQRHPDAAAWRRALVDEGLMDRDHGEYWRADALDDDPRREIASGGS